jgi:hypothetical protein
MLIKLAHLNTDEHRKSYITSLTKALREKYGMETKRDKRYGKSRKKTGAKKPITQKPIAEQIADSLFGAGLIGQRKYTGSSISTGHDLADAMRKHDMGNMVEISKKIYADIERPPRISDEDRIVEEYVKLDDAYKSLQFKYDDLEDSVGELKREIARLQVIITYLEGRK